MKEPWTNRWLRYGAYLAYALAAYWVAVAWFKIPVWSDRPWKQFALAAVGIGCGVVGWILFERQAAHDGGKEGPKSKNKK